MEDLFFFHGKWSANNVFYELTSLTGSSSGGAFPESVFERNFSQVLSQFLSLIWTVDKQTWKVEQLTQIHLQLIK